MYLWAQLKNENKEIIREMKNFISDNEIGSCTNKSHFFRQFENGCS